LRAGSISAGDLYLIQLAAMAIVLSILQWSLVFWRLRFPEKLVPLYPVSVVYFAGLAIRSLVFNLTGKATWKGRNIKLV
jgi:hypothetical protein